MSYRFICIPLITTLICCTFSEKAATVELVNKQFIDANQLTNIVRAKNSSKVLYVKSNDSATNDKNVDKQPRTTNHRQESESRAAADPNTILIFLHGPILIIITFLRLAVDIRPSTANVYQPIGTVGRRTDNHQVGAEVQEDPEVIATLEARYTKGVKQETGNRLLYNRDYTLQFCETTLTLLRTSDRFASRPKYGSESSRKPGSYESTSSGGYDYGGYGEYGFNRPNGYGGSTSSGGYGISGTFANGDEFGAAEPNYPEGNASLQPNIQAQKAVALKALAGVALIGAAAALAANPVLLPIGIVSGRRKRSSFPTARDDLYIDYLLKTLKINATKAHDNEDEQQISPTCIARVICEIQKRYWSDLEKKNNILKKRKELESRFTNLISDNVLEARAINERVKKLINAATVVASNGWRCSTFTCTVIKTTEAKNKLTFKV